MKSILEIAARSWSMYVASRRANRTSLLTPVLGKQHKLLILRGSCPLPFIVSRLAAVRRYPFARRSFRNA